MRIGPSSYLLLALLTFASHPAFGHGNGHHEPKPQATPTSTDVPFNSVIAAINETYIRDVKPIFEKKCMDCHSTKTQFPWYSKLPGVKQWINHHISEAKEHLDLTHDYPFHGHGSPLEDLEELQKTVREGSMPLWSYRMMHSGSELTHLEKEAIVTWAKRTAESLKQTSGKAN